MSSKLYSRPGVFVWSPPTIENKGVIVADFAQYFDPNATFNELAWSVLCSEQHSLGVIGGGTEDGTVVFFDAAKFVNDSKFEVLSARRDHHGHVLTIDVSRDGRWMASGGGSGQILLWDTTNLSTPFSPGVPNFQDPSKIVRWNNKNHVLFASISSHRASCWDLRRNGAPVLEFAEIGAGCDWSSLCWSPNDASQLIIGSQSQSASVIQKWDMRYTTTPIKEYRHHNMGITSIDWNKRDDRLLVSSGSDGQVAIWNHETGEILGGAGSLQGDWIKNVKWNEAEPSQFAIQYYHHPLQISSITSLGTPQPGAEVLASRITENFIPQWLSAPVVGASLSIGGKLATHWKSFDSKLQRWVYNVEIENIPPDEELLKEAQDLVAAKSTKSNLGWFLDEKTKMLADLELVNEEIVETNGTMTTNNTSKSYSHTNGTTETITSTTRSSSSCSTETAGPEISFVEKAANIDWRQLVEPQVDPLSSLVTVLSSSTSEKTSTATSHENKENTLKLLNSFPSEQWKILLGVLISQENSPHELAEAAQTIGIEWLNGKNPLRACIAFILAGDVENLMRANTHFTLCERIIQGIAIHKHGNSVFSSFGPNFEKAILSYGEKLMKNGLAELAWKMVSDMNETTDEQLIELRHTLYVACGGRDCTGDPEPKNPWVSEPPPTPKLQPTFQPQNMGPYNSRFSSQVPPPAPPTAYADRRSSNVVPMPPSSMFYQNQSWNQTPPPLTTNAPIQKPPATIQSGWNDPPPLAPKQVKKANVMQVNWKPLDAPNVPGGMHPLVQPVPLRPLAPLQNQMQNMSLNSGPPSTVTSSSYSPVTNAPQPVAPIQLSAEDEKILGPIETMAQWIIDNARAPGKAEKASTLKSRIRAELGLRLAQNRLTAESKTLLNHIAFIASNGQLREAQASIGQLARNSSDFVEVSSFLPALKSLFALASH
ncbi:unnamed protein product [Caenorhabditis bovis]|uniref:Ancestral coatomer element 1 Sec16/Sec31 domain-containing protein n=1 Tax=Caenorhabditis bovis TaxID=2654633 RepID=A0A8S1EZT7_9PELO|nr:unnamed protein product [Caenorhabditis bovis]